MSYIAMRDRVFTSLAFTGKMPVLPKAQSHVNTCLVERYICNSIDACLQNRIFVILKSR